MNWKQKTFVLDLLGAKQYLVDANRNVLKQTFLKLKCSFCHNSTIMKQILEEEVYTLITNFSSSFVHEEENGSRGVPRWYCEARSAPVPHNKFLILFCPWRGEWISWVLNVGTFLHPFPFHIWTHPNCAMHNRKLRFTDVGRRGKEGIQFLVCRFWWRWIFGHDFYSYRKKF